MRAIARTHASICGTSLTSVKSLMSVAHITSVCETYCLGHSNEEHKKE